MKSLPKQIEESVLRQVLKRLLTAKRDHAATRRLFERAIGLHDVPEKITIDKSGANTAAVNSLIADSGRKSRCANRNI